LINLIDDSDEEMEVQDTISAHKLSLLSRSYTDESGYITTNSIHQNCSQNSTLSVMEEVMEVSELSVKSSEDDVKNLSEDYIETLPMMPNESDELSYSYQSMQSIKNFWAGPSYWQFHQNKSDSKETSRRSKKRKLTNEVTLESINSLIKKDELVDFCSTSTKECRNFHQNSLPIDFQIGSQCFDCFTNSQNIDMTTPFETNVNVEVTDVLHSTAINTGVDDEFVNFFPDVSEMRVTQNSPPHTKSHNAFDFPMSQLPKRRRVCDMKLIKETVLAVMTSESKLNDTRLSFHEVARKSSKLLSETNENGSFAVLFQALLHLSHEGKVKIESHINEIDDFFVMLS
jgi:hypothetical protein